MLVGLPAAGGRPWISARVQVLPKHVKMPAVHEGERSAATDRYGSPAALNAGRPNKIVLCFLQ